MKFHIYNPLESNKTFFSSMHSLFQFSMLDLGHVETSYDDAELIISIQHTKDYKKDIGKKSIIIQIEDQFQRNNKYSDSRGQADRIWGFDFFHPYEEYIYLGYHPAFDLTVQSYPINKGIVFLGGGNTERRKKYLELYKISSVIEWDSYKKIERLREYGINIHFHAYQGTRFTPWDRLFLNLSNKIFTMSEECYMPEELKLFPRFDPEDCQEKINEYMSDEGKRMDIAQELYFVWKEKFDMRTLLEKKLSV